MSQTKKPGFNVRKALVRAGLLVLYVALVYLAFVTGKGHTVLVDNKDHEASGVTAFETVTVGVDRQETQELYPGDRVMFKVKSQKHTISLEIMGQSEKIVRTLVLPMDAEMVVVNLPRLAKGLEPYWETFVPVHAAPVAQEADGAFTSPDAPLVPEADFVPEPKAP